MQSLVRVSLHDGHRRQDYTSAITLSASLVRVSLHDGHRRKDYTSAIMLSASLVRVSFQKFRGSASCSYIRQTYGNIDSDDCYVRLRMNEEYPWQGSASKSFAAARRAIVFDRRMAIPVATIA